MSESSHDDLGFVEDDHSDLGFEPDSAALSAAPPKPATLGPGATFGAHTMRHLAFGLGDKILAAEEALSEKLHDKTGKTTFSDAYKRNLGFNDKLLEASDEANPKARWAGNAAGFVGNAAALAAVAPARAAIAARGLLPAAEATAPAASVMGRALQGAGEGARLGGALGAVGGYGGSRADGVGGTARDTGIGALAGLTLGGLFGGAASGGQALLSSKADALKNLAINQGRRVLTNGADSLSTRNMVRPEAVEEAIRSGAIRPFSNTASTLERLKALADRQGDVYGSIVDQLEASGVRGPAAQELAAKLAARAAEVEPNTMNRAIPEAFRSASEDVAKKAAADSTLGLSQAENLKRSLQEAARYGRFEETPVNEARREIASIFRQANEDAIEEAAQGAGEGSQVRALADQFVPAKRRLGNILEAESAATRGAARGAQRGHFGLKETIHSAAAMAAGHPGFAPALGLGSNFIRTRAPSAVASYGLSLADLAARQGATPGAAQLGAGLVGGLLGDATDDEIRQAAMVQALRGRK